MTAMTAEDRIVHCPKCGMRVWRRKLETEGCGICRTLDSRDAPTRTDR